MVKNQIVICCPEIPLAEIERLKEQLDKMPIGSRIITNSPQTVKVLAFNRVWVNPFYCENFSRFWRNTEIGNPCLECIYKNTNWCRYLCFSRDLIG